MVTEPAGRGNPKNCFVGGSFNLGDITPLRGDLQGGGGRRKEPLTTEQ